MAIYLVFFMSELNVKLLIAQFCVIVAVIKIFSFNAIVIC